MVLTLEANVVGGVHYNRGESHEVPEGLDAKRNFLYFVRMGWDAMRWTE